MVFFPGRKKPDPNKNFFQNYIDHGAHVRDQQIAFYTKFQTSEKPLQLLVDEAVSHLYILDALRDGHDYFDEVVGATAIPLLCATASLALAGLAIWEACTALYIKCDPSKNDGEDHGQKAKKALLLAGAAFVLAIGCFVKSVISLFTRPIATLLPHAKLQDKERFYDDKVAECNEGFQQSIISALGFGS